MTALINSIAMTMMPKTSQVVFASDVQLSSMVPFQTDGIDAAVRFVTPPNDFGSNRTAAIAGTDNRYAFTFLRLRSNAAAPPMPVANNSMALGSGVSDGTPNAST